MASTSKKKEAKKQIVKLDPKAEKILTSSDLYALTDKSHNTRHVKMLMALEEQRLRNMLLEKTLLEHNIQKQEALRNARHGEYLNSSKQFSQFKQELWKKYGLDDAKDYGYDAISGKIVE